MYYIKRLIFSLFSKQSYYFDIKNAERLAMPEKKCMWVPSKISQTSDRNAHV
jgi:hypothetical protein